MQWPKEIPEKLITALEREAKAARELQAAVEQHRALGYTVMRRDAKAIETGAKKLLKQVQSFRQHYFCEFVNDNVKVKACAHFAENEPYAEEVSAFEIGLGDYSVECAILGLITKMQIIDTPKKRGSTKHPERHTISNIARLFERAQLPVGKNETFIQAANNVFELAGIKAGGDAIEHYIRSRKAQKTT